MPRVIHFEISADEPYRAAKFYKDVFGWEINKWNGPWDYWLVTTGSSNEEGINGGIFKRKGYANHVNTIDVSSVDEFVKKVIDNGGSIALEKKHIPGVGYTAYCKDTEDNVFGILECEQKDK